jgi:hypothetical protein
MRKYIQLSKRKYADEKNKVCLSKLKRALLFYFNQQSSIQAIEEIVEGKQRNVPHLKNT